jgi:hypothetical protein
MTNTTIRKSLTSATTPVQSALFELVGDLAPSEGAKATRLRRSLIDAEAAYVHALSDAESFLDEYGVEL